MRPSTVCPSPSHVTVRAFFAGREIQHRHLDPQRRRVFVVGCGRRVDAPVPDADPTAPPWKLVSVERGTPIVHPGPNMRAEIHDPQGGPARLATTAFALTGGDRCWIDAGRVTFLVEGTERAPGLPRSSWRGWRADLLPAGVALVAVALVALMLAWLPPDLRALAFQDLRTSLRPLPVLIKPHELRPSPATATERHAPVVAAPTTSAPTTSRKPASPRTSAGAPPRAAARTPDQVGLLGVLTAAARTNPDVAALFGRGTALDGSDGEGLSTVGDALGAAAQVGSPTASTGLGDALVALSGPTRPRRAGSTGAARLEPRVQGLIAVDPGPTVSRGGLDRELVRRTVRQHMNQIRHCYERALLQAPQLAGRVVVRFVIAPGGRVLSAATESSTTGSPRLDGCVLQAVQRLEFPAAPDGGPVIVSYPFLFVRAAGQ